ncbi:MAG: alpha amylase C-terminal domain-containing protein [Cyanobacteria bacterium P01_H01_bin.121]
MAYGGSGVHNGGKVTAHPWEHNTRWPYALSLTLPPLGVLVFGLAR